LHADHFADISELVYHFGDRKWCENSLLQILHHIHKSGVTGTMGLWALDCKKVLCCVIEENNNAVLGGWGACKMEYHHQDAVGEMVPIIMQSSIVSLSRAFDWGLN
jgi:hypothetical protein